MSHPTDRALALASEPRPRLPWPAYVKASLAWHAGAAGAVLAAPQAWPWALGAVAANHVVLTAGGLWPRSRWLGSNWTRLPAAAAARREIAITIDDGPDPEVTPLVLDLLDRDGAHATFFCIAEQVRTHAALCREIVARGHSVQNHSDRHAHSFSLLGPKAMAREHRLRVAAGDILHAHDGHAARTHDGVPLVVAVLPALLERVRSAGLHPATLADALPEPSEAASGSFATATQ